MITAEGTKRCSACGETKPVSGFHRQTRGDGYAYRCKPCGVEYLRRRRSEKPEVHREYDRRWRAANPEKKAAWDRRYYEQNKGRVRAQAKSYYEANRDEIREAERRKKRGDPEKYALYERKRALARYGLTIEDYDALLEDQAGVCAICGKPCRSGRRLAVDHCHTSGKVRGLLCVTCNQGLGAFEDNPELFSAAVRYLRERG